MTLHQYQRNAREKGWVPLVLSVFVFLHAGRFLETQLHFAEANFMDSPEGTSINETYCSLATSRQSSWTMRRKRAEAARTAEMAYTMAILSGMSYWNFHHDVPGNETDGFRLQEKEQRKFLHEDGLLALCRASRAIEATSPSMIMEQFYSKEDPNIGPSQKSCREKIRQSLRSKKQYDFQWYLYNWHEPTPVVARWHDTDLLVSTSGQHTLILSFAGTASVADTFTNVQTFEPVGHSQLFNESNITGSIHRGFLNAYSRVARGLVAKIGNQSEDCPLTESLRHRYDHCYNSKKATRSEANQKLKGNETYTDRDQTNPEENSKSNGPRENRKQKRKRCHAHGEKLMSVLRELVTRALADGRAVHITGHSLGGGLATIMAVDIILNFPKVDVSRLHLWTFGAPEVADGIFWRSAMASSTRLQSFFRRKRRRNQCHRYVTLSDSCQADVVSSIVSKTLPSHHKGPRGFLARRLGGVRGGAVHYVEPHYLLPSLLAATNEDVLNSSRTTPSTTSTVISTHQITNYLQGIARESRNDLLKSNLPEEMSTFIGERVIG